MSAPKDELLAAFDAASRAIKLSPTVREGGVGADARYGAAHAALVRAGLSSPLRRKYTRGGRGGARK